jgi:type II secretory pathway component GspD/PulD (secretin)
MNAKIPACILFCALAISTNARADTAPAPSSSESADTGIPLAKIIQGVAKRTGKKFLIDPRVHAQVQLIGQDVSSITYGDLLSILMLNGYTAVDEGGYIMVLPDAGGRTLPVPQAVSARETFPDAMVVSKVIPVKNMPAAFLVPILRPLLPQQAHLAAAYCSNAILMVDTYANVKRIESLIESLDTGTPFKPEKCDQASPGAHRETAEHP